MCRPVQYLLHSLLHHTPGTSSSSLNRTIVTSVQDVQANTCLVMRTRDDGSGRCVLGTSKNALCLQRVITQHERTCTCYECRRSSKPILLLQSTHLAFLYWAVAAYATVLEVSVHRRTLTALAGSHSLSVQVTITAPSNCVLTRSSAFTLGTRTSLQRAAH